MADRSDWRSSSEPEGEGGAQGGQQRFSGSRFSEPLRKTQNTFKSKNRQNPYNPASMQKTAEATLNPLKPLNPLNQ